jgi:hypothetical protein
LNVAPRSSRTSPEADEVRDELVIGPPTIWSDAAFCHPHIGM